MASSPHSQLWPLETNTPLKYSESLESHGILVSACSSCRFFGFSEVHLCPDDGPLLRPHPRSETMQKTQRESTRINGTDLSDLSDLEAFPLLLMAHQSCGPPLGTPAPPLAKALWDAVVVVLPLSQPQCENRSCRMISLAIAAIKNAILIAAIGLILD